LRCLRCERGDKRRQCRVWEDEILTPLK